MRYRQLSPSGDYTFGGGQANFLINSPAAVAQVVETSLKLWLGEWYLDTTVGVPYIEGILGRFPQAQADAIIQAYINQCQGVVNIQNYESVVNSATRAYTSISGTLNTIYGQTELQASLSGDF